MPKPRRRAPGEGSVYRRPNGTWSGQFDLGWGPDGRRRKTIYGKTQTDVLKKMGQLRRHLEESGDLATSDTKLGAWLDWWLDNVAARKVKPNTLRSYRTAVGEHIKPSIGNIRLGKLQVHHITGMHEALMGRGLSSTTARNAHRILSVALNSAVKYEKVHRNVATLADVPGRAASTRSALSADDARKVLMRAAELVDAGDTLAIRWVVSLLYGLRQGERLALRWSAVDFDRGEIDCAWSLQRVPWRHGCRTPDEHTARRCPKRTLAIPADQEHRRLDGALVLLRPKTEGSIRMLPLIEPVASALRRRRAAVEAERPGYRVDHDLVFCRPDGKALDPRQDWQHWTDLFVDCGVAHMTGHEARHTAVTLLYTLGVDPEVVRQIVGHSDIATQRLYRHADLTRPREALSRLADLIAIAPAG